MSLQQRHHVQCYGWGETTLMFAHGYGCDQNMWRFLTPQLARRYRVITYDLAGCGKAAPDSYDFERHASLHGHADDALHIIERFANGPVVFVGHSVSAMIGMLAAIRQPQHFVGQIMIGPSPCFLNDGDYVGGYNREDIDGLLQSMIDNYQAWSATMGKLIMGTPERPELAAELSQRFRCNDPAIALHFGRVTFLSDHRADVARSTLPTLILQCSDDLIAPREVGDWLHQHLAHSMLKVIHNTGHCPHFSAPGVTFDFIDSYLRQSLGR